jgi:hypothetical protein
MSSTKSRPTNQLLETIREVSEESVQEEGKEEREETGERIRTFVR